MKNTSIQTKMERFWRKKLLPAILCTSLGVGMLSGAGTAASWDIEEISDVEKAYPEDAVVFSLEEEPGTEWSVPEPEEVPGEALFEGEDAEDGQELPDESDDPNGWSGEELPEGFLIEEDPGDVQMEELPEEAYPSMEGFAEEQTLAEGTLGEESFEEEIFEEETFAPEDAAMWDLLEEETEPADAGSGSVRAPAWLIRSEEDGDSAALFEAYTHRVFYEGLETERSDASVAGGPRKAKKAPLSGRLNAAETVVYDTLKERITKVASGGYGSTVVNIAISKLGLAVRYTAEDLGIDVLAEESERGTLLITQDAVDAMNRMLTEQVDLQRVVEALMGDLPYELYWYDKTGGTQVELPAFSYSASTDSISFDKGSSASVTLSMTVMAAYRKGQQTYRVDTGKTGAASAAAARAKEVVAAAAQAGLSDLEMLTAYRDFILNAVSYDREALRAYAQDETFTDAWQLIYVFDGDDTTNVVCEGYSKAFQYLCDLSSFSDDTIEARSVTGYFTSGGSGREDHMWNLVSIGGNTYLADLTNCDSDAGLRNPQLFLGGTAGSVEEGYRFVLSEESDIRYVYDAAARSLYTREELSLLEHSYEEELALQAAAEEEKKPSIPEQKDGVYQIGSPEELLSFAALVNGTLEGMAQDTAADAVLTADISLMDVDWIPIGEIGSGKRYRGTFDGQGHVIEDLYLKTDAVAAGLFGCIEGATIRNLILRGSITSSGNAVAGFAARTYGKCLFENCGNEAEITNTGRSGAAGGLTAQSDAADTYRGCYNRAAITAVYRASGIAAYVFDGVFARCYNTGTVTAATAVGVGCASTGHFKDCYSAGTVTGEEKKAHSLSGSAYSDYENSYYVTGRAADDTEAYGTPVSLETITRPAFAARLGETEWKADLKQINSGFPILAWEPSDVSIGTVLTPPERLSWQAPDAETQALLQDPGVLACAAPVASWEAVAGAEGYQLRLYQKSLLGTDGGSQPVYCSEVLSGTSLDLTEVFDAMDPALSDRFVFTVTVLGDGLYYLDSPESEPDETGYAYDGAVYLAAPKNLVWNEASRAAAWDGVPGASFYVAALYSDTQKVVEYTLPELEGEERVTMHFLSQTGHSGDYTYTVRAGRVITDPDSPYAGKTVYGVPARSPQARFEGDASGRIEIASASDWMRIVNETAKGTQYLSDADAQNVAWAKNYVLTEDLDFSNLTAEEQNQTKSWGNIDAMFQGTLDGGGHVIRGLTLSNGDAGLFAYIGSYGVVKNVVIENANVLFSDNAAAFVWLNYGTIENCRVINTNITADTGSVIGGFVSRNYGRIEGCSVEGGTLVSNGTGTGYAGFVGNNFGAINRCYTSMDVETTGFSAGGFAGWADSSGERVGSFTDCFALGNVTASYGWSGGFIGRINDSRVTFTNCYAAGVVSSSEKPDRVYGFTGTVGGDAQRDLVGSSAFDITVGSDNFIHCYYDADATSRENEKAYAQGIAGASMRREDFAASLGDSYEWDASQNSGLPYLQGLPVPTKAVTRNMTVQLAVAVYDTQSYSFVTDTLTSVTLETNGNSRVMDVLSAAREQGLIDYTYSVTSAYGSFVESINGHALASPDGWMFTINDILSPVSAQLAAVQDADRILWFMGTTQNLFRAPSWQEITGEIIPGSAVEIRTPQELAALCEEGADLRGSYVLAADLDLSGMLFPGIGDKEHPFAGTFDGNGHTIRGLTIQKGETEGGAGLFNFILGATLRNVALQEASVTAGYGVGLLVGNAGVSLGTVSADQSIGNQIRGCRVSGTVTALRSTNEGAYAGGLVGFNDGDTDTKTGISMFSSIDRCSADCVVKANSLYAGGFAGGNFGYITNCESTGDVTGTRMAGGFAGENDGGIYDCSASGTVRADAYVGGFAGGSAMTVMRCLSTGDVYGTEECIGGFAGSASGTVKDCISTGTVHLVSDSNYTGGMIGYYAGVLAGLPQDITFSGNSAWCVDSEGKILSPIGNRTAYTSEAQTEVLSATQVTDADELARRVKELFQSASLNRAQLHLVRLREIAEAICRTTGGGLDWADTSTPWMIADLAVYEQLTGSGPMLAQEQKDAYAAFVAEQTSAYLTKASYKVTLTDLAKYLLSLRALGADASALPMPTGNGTVNLREAFLSEMRSLPIAVQNSYALPYLLLVLRQENAGDDVQRAIVEELFGRQRSDGGWGNAELDLDMTAPIVLALSDDMDQDDVRAAIEKALDPERIAAVMSESGAVGMAGTPSAETTGLLLAAVTAAGLDPTAYCKGGMGLADGLLSLTNADGTGFLYQGSSNFMATEQGFRGILGVLLAQEGKGRIFRFAPVEEHAPEGGEDKPGSGETESGSGTGSAGGSTGGSTDGSASGGSTSVGGSTSIGSGSTGGSGSGGTNAGSSGNGKEAVLLEENLQAEILQAKRAQKDLQASIQALRKAVAKLQTKKQKITQKKPKAGKKKITVSWKKPAAVADGSGIKGYQVYVSLKKTKGFRLSATVSGGKKQKVVVKKIGAKKLKAKTTYYVKVRGYRIIGKKRIYTKFSKVRKVKVK